MCRGVMDPAHTKTGGMGRKSDKENVFPACRKHHEMYDDRIAPFDEEWVRAIAVRAAAETEAAWQRYLHFEGREWA
jgi:hypothetical protein